MLDLLRPFAYLTVKHPSGLPMRVNWIAPLVLTALVMSGSWALATTPINIFQAQGVLERLLGFVQTLVGFYIAALAAVSSFNSPHLDRLMPKPAPTMRIKHNGQVTEVEATRRRFLTSMFAYLTALSFLFTLAAIAILTLAGPVAAKFADAVVWLRPFVVFCFLAPLFQMTCITFWGLFYLGERMLTPD